MNLSDNEKYLKDLLGDGEQELDTNLVWEAVEPRLKKKRKRRFIIWWFFGVGILFSGLLWFSTQFWKEKKESVQVLMIKF